MVERIPYFAYDKSIKAIQGESVIEAIRAKLRQVGVNFKDCPNSESGGPGITLLLTSLGRSDFDEYVITPKEIVVREDSEEKIYTFGNGTLTAVLLPHHSFQTHLRQIGILNKSNDPVGSLPMRGVIRVEADGVVWQNVYFNWDGTPKK